MGLLEDVARGTTLRDLSASAELKADLADTRGAGGLVRRTLEATVECVPKSPGWTIVLRSGTFGLPVDFPIILRRSSAGVDEMGRTIVEWSIDHSVQVEGDFEGNLATIEKARGQLTTQITDIPPQQASNCAGLPNTFFTRIQTVAGRRPNEIEFPGHSGPVTARGLRFLAWVENVTATVNVGEPTAANPSTARIRLFAYPAMCNRDYPRGVWGELALATPVPPVSRDTTGELQVNLIVDPPDVGIEPPSPLVFVAGDQTKRFQLSIPAGFGGLVRVSSPDLDRPSAVFEVGAPRPPAPTPPPDSVPGPVSHFTCADTIRLHEPADIWRPPTPCPACDYTRLGDGGDLAGFRLGEAFRLLRGGQIEIFGSLLPGRVELGALNANGDLVGGLHSGDGAAEGFMLRADARAAKEAFVRLPFVATAIDDAGDMGGYAVQKGVERAVVTRKGEVIDVPIGDAQTSRIVALANGGALAGWVDRGNGREGFVGTLDQIVMLKGPEGPLSPVAVNDDGLFIANAFKSSGGATAFVGAGEEVVPIEPPKGYASAVAFDLNREGVVVGVLVPEDETTERPRGFWYSIHTGVIDLNDPRTTSDAGSFVVAGLKVNNGGDLLVYAERDGAPGFVVLSPTVTSKG